MFKDLNLRCRRNETKGDSLGELVVGEIGVGETGTCLKGIVSISVTDGAVGETACTPDNTPTVCTGQPTICSSYQNRVDLAYMLIYVQTQRSMDVNIYLLRGW